jgi:hypothetical protein
VLEQIDGQPLPQLTNLGGDDDCTLTQSTLELQANKTLNWQIECNVPGNPQITSYYVSSPFRQAAVDSVEFTTDGLSTPDYWAAGQKQGSVLVLKTVAVHSDGPLPTPLDPVGVHTWTFRLQP